MARAALLGGVLGSTAGLAFGMLSLNRPLLNALVFYVLGFLLGTVAGAALALLRSGSAAAGRPRPKRRGPSREVP